MSLYLKSHLSFSLPHIQSPVLYCDDSERSPEIPFHTCLSKEKIPFYSVITIFTCLLLRDIPSDLVDEAITRTVKSRASKRKGSGWAGEAREEYNKKCEKHDI